MSDFRFGPICGHYSPGCLWVRLWAGGGPGFLAKDTRRHWLLFSQRLGFGGIRMGWLWVGWL